MPDLPLLLFQIGVILVLARAVGWLFRKIHQPQVMGEMVAGLMLGPSLLGWVSPGVSSLLFPPESLGFLSALSEIGLVLFMFLIGLELDPKIMKGRGRTTFFISQVSIIAPFLLGAGLALYLYPRLSEGDTSLLHFALFMGAAMSITAFPVLARILAERRMLRTSTGAVAIASAAVNDVTGWCILAGLVLLVRANDASMPLWATLLGVFVYVVVMLFGVKRLLKNLESVFEKRAQITQDVLSLILLLVLASSWITEWLGIHALFGAFLLGVIMPKHDGLVHALTGKLNDAAVVLLLPIFFAFTGLRTSLGLLNGSEMWFLCGLVIFVAILGKFGGSSLAAKITGSSWREAGALGVLMNTRGLMELVLLNIGLNLGVISPTVFAMLVLMALVTTFMTAPVLEWIYFARLIPEEYPLTVLQVDIPALESLNEQEIT